MNWQDRILNDPQVLRGKPSITGTRIPADLVLGYPSRPLVKIITAYEPDPAEWDASLKHRK